MHTKAIYFATNGLWSIIRVVLIHLKDERNFIKKAVISRLLLPNSLNYQVSKTAKHGDNLSLR